MSEQATIIDLDQLQPQASPYPQLGFDVKPEMATVYIVLGPLTTITQGIPPGVMDDIVARWNARHDASQE